MTAIKRIALLNLICLFMTPVSAHAQNALGSSNGEPLEITADGTLEWLRAQNQFIARDNARVQQGDTSVDANTLTAFYREGKGEGEQNMQIWKIIAQDDVVLKSSDSTAYGQRAVYNLDEGLATLTGHNLRMIAPDQTVTARDRFEYHLDTGRVHAIGKAKVIRPKAGGGQDVLESDKITATLKENKSGKQMLDTLDANGNVIITTPMERATGASGTFNADTNMAELKGNVKIIRGKNILEGERATVDLNTNVSKIYGSKTPNSVNNKPNTGRVRAIFYPGTEDN